jgi:tetrapyrrole methylase family protein/MazG family protein
MSCQRKSEIWPNKMDANRLSKALLDLRDLVFRLRGDNGCPWDILQTDATIKMYLLEEAYEVLDAIERGKPADVCQELGDLLFQIMFLVSLAEERGEFDLVEVVERIAEKMRYRHPHVFGEVKVGSAEEVADNWQKLKKREKKEPESLSAQLRGLPLDLPALLRAHRLSERASRASLHGSVVEVEWGKVERHFRELQKAVSTSDKEWIGQQMGEILFALASLARDQGLNAESLLRQTNQEFVQRVEETEQALEEADLRVDQPATEDAKQSQDEVKIKEE